MGSMSTSDAAPLPRLGEVFFDVRSASRSLRISWYADTGVAVLSIWQGGTCTGSFRLPMADLPRMIETLQRGPDGWAASVAGGLPADEPARTGAAGQDRYPAGSGSLHYLNGQPPGEYPDQPGAAPYRDQAATPRYPDQHATARYPDQQAGYPAGPGHQDMAAGPPRGRYPNDSGPGSYSAGLAGHESRPDPLVPPYDRGRPGWPAAQQETGRDTGHASPAGHGLEPLPESFPYSHLLPDHELR